MTDPVQPRPQPVVDAGKLGGLVSGALVACSSVFFLVQAGINPDSITAIGVAVQGAVTAVVSLLAYLLPKLHAKKAAAHVTPLSDPRNDRGEPLVDPDTYGRHAAKYDNGGILPPAMTTVSNDTGSPIRVVGRDELVRLDTNRTDTQEIPRVTRRPLGRKPPTNAPRIKLTASMVPAAAFTPPPSVDWYTKVPASSWGMDGNDTVGDCTCAEVDHSTKARQVAAGNPEVRSTVAEILGAYSAITGYDPNKTRPDGSNPTDQGAVMQDVRDYWRKSGIILGNKLNKLTLFAQVDHTDLNLIKWCVARFGAVALGINFPSSAMDQFDAGQPWDVVKGASIEGGHAISMVGYDDRFAYVVTWGKVQPMTWAFFGKYVEEAWTDVSADWINTESGQDPLGEVAYALGEQFAQVTGKPNPFPAPAPEPAPTPAPSPQPAPEPVPVVTLPPDTVRAWAEHTQRLKDEPHYARTGSADYLAWLASVTK